MLVLSNIHILVDCSESTFSLLKLNINDKRFLAYFVVADYTLGQNQVSLSIQKSQDKICMFIDASCYLLRSGVYPRTPVASSRAAPLPH